MTWLDDLQMVSCVIAEKLAPRRRERCSLNRPLVRTLRPLRPLLHAVMSFLF